MLTTHIGGFAVVSGNWVLGGLSEFDKNLLRPHLQDVVLPPESLLCARDRKEEQLYFPYRGTASLIAQTANGGTIEMATVGRDGVVGCLTALGMQRGFATAVANVELGAFRIATTRLLELLPNAETLRAALVADAERLLFQIQQLSGCNALHPIEERVARLLLRAADCLGSSVIPLTQELMSQMLGVQRTTVNLVIRMMANAGAVRSRRGHVEIIDRSILESRTCECYASVRRCLESSVAPLADQPASRSQ
jgi:CRP-like cAMP-binding protein